MENHQKMSGEKAGGGGGAFPNQLAIHMPSKRKGGLGNLDLERFAGAIRLKWLWFTETKRSSMEQ